jgi:nitrogen regulatory protein PII
MDKQSKPSLRLLFIIIDWDKARAVSHIFGERFVFMGKGMGTASSEILDLLGIGSSEKAVLLCLEQKETALSLVDNLRSKLGASSAGAGITFTVPLSGINAPIVNILLEEKTDKGAEESKEKTEMESKNEGIEIKNDLIISILNNGYSDEFMKVARDAGARGGTVINARGLSQQKVKRFLGISVQEEKEIIIILTDRNKKIPIMQAVSSEYGTTSKAEGVVFSLPVDQVMSLNQQF